MPPQIESSTNRSRRRMIFVKSPKLGMPSSRQFLIRAVFLEDSTSECVRAPQMGTLRNFSEADRMPAWKSGANATLAALFQSKRSKKLWLTAPSLCEGIAEGMRAIAPFHELLIDQPLDDVAMD